VIQKAYCRSGEHLHTDRQSIFFDVEAWVVVGIDLPRIAVAGSNDEVAAGHGIEEEGHIIAAWRTSSVMAGSFVQGGQLSAQMSTSQEPPIAVAIPSATSISAFKLSG